MDSRGNDRTGAAAAGKGSAMVDGVEGSLGLMGDGMARQDGGLREDDAGVSACSARDGARISLSCPSGILFILVMYR